MMDRVFAEALPLGKPRCEIRNDGGTVRGSGAADGLNDGVVLGGRFHRQILPFQNCLLERRHVFIAAA